MEVVARCPAAFTDRKDLLSFNCAMAQIRMDVRDSHGQPLPALCDEFFDLGLPVDHSRLAQSLLRMLRDDQGQSAARSVHLIRDGEEIGAWSVAREQAEAAHAGAGTFTPPVAA
jgi:hypothetical protein